MSALLVVVVVDVVLAFVVVGVVFRHWCLLRSMFLWKG